MKRLISLILAILCCTSTVFAHYEEESEYYYRYKANGLHEEGLFSGTGVDQYGAPIYDLDRAPTREEAVTMLVSMLGAGKIAAEGDWYLPFSDVSAWAKPYIGYAYSKGLTAGTSATTFSGSTPVTATQFITMMLQALGYQSGVDFEWDKAWILTDKLGITNRQITSAYNGELDQIQSVADYKNGGTGPNGLFTRGDAVALMFAILNQKVTLKNSDMTINRSILNTKTSSLPTERSTYDGSPAFVVANTSVESVIDCMRSGVELGYESFYIFAPCYGLMEDISYSWQNPVQNFASEYNLSLKSTYFYDIVFSPGGGLFSFGPPDTSAFFVHVGTRSSNPNAPWNSDQNTSGQGSQESTSDIPPDYYDQWGRAVYIDEFGYPYYLDRQGYPTYVGTPVDDHYGEYPPHDAPVYYDEQGRAVYQHVSGRYYIIDSDGHICFCQ